MACKVKASELKKKKISENSGRERESLQQSEEDSTFTEREEEIWPQSDQRNDET